MAFSQETQEQIELVAELAEQMYGMYGTPPKGMDWATIITIALSLLQQLCKPKTEQARKAFLNALAKKVSTNGVEGCPDCLPNKAREKWRKRLAKRAKVKSASVQDRALYCVVMAAQAKQEAAVSGMSSAYENDEDDDEDT